MREKKGVGQILNRQVLIFASSTARGLQLKHVSLKEGDVTFRRSLGKSLPLLRPSRLLINCWQDIFFPMFWREQHKNDTIQFCHWNFQLTPSCLSNNSAAQKGFNLKSAHDLEKLWVQSSNCTLGGIVTQLYRVVIKEALGLHHSRSPFHSLPLFPFLIKMQHERLKRE